jgi:hypothetical protein
VRVADLQVDELLPRELRLDGGSCVFDRGTETDTDKAKDSAVSFADAKDVVLEVCACCTCNC